MKLSKLFRPGLIWCIKCFITCLDCCHYRTKSWRWPQLA